METTTLTLAAQLCGGAEEDEVLKALCAAAEAMWESRLDAGISKESCGGTLRCAAAFTAAADYLGKACGGAESFTVGEVTVKGMTGTDVKAMAEALRQTAERLMRPFAAAGDFCFKGVQG